LAARRGISQGRSRRRAAERPANASEAQDVAIGKLPRSFKALVSDECAVLALEILDFRSIAADANRGVTSGDRRQIQENHRIG
jgi:hypothetical protein